MGVLDQNIELFTYRSQVKITELGGQMLSDDLNGLCIDNYIDLIDQLNSAIYLLQNSPDDMSDNEKEEVMSYLYDKAELNPLPLPLYRQCGCNSTVSVTGGYIPVPGPVGPTGPQGPTGPTGPAGNDGIDGANGLNGWTSVQSIVLDGEREVVKITDWIGGTGNKPTTLPVYIGANGFVTSISQAVNIKGSAGPAGPKGNTGATGPAGASAYVYTAYADADDGTGFTLTFNSSKYYIAIITTTAPIVPVVSDFTGKWFKWKGDVGPALNINERGPLSDRSLYDNEAQDFIFFAIDTNEIYIKDTGLSGDWSDPIPFGGNQGWSPIISVHQDGDRDVLYVGGWIGGQGTYPTYSGYVSGSGLTSDISFAIDIRGSRGKRFYPDAQDVIGNISLYNDAPPEYVFYATDEGKVYIKQTSLTGDWSVGYVWRGPQGPVGSTGSPGKGFSEDCKVATTGNLSGTYSSGVFTFSSNGTISIDSVSLVLNERVLVKNQTTKSQNGIYIVSDTGSVSTPAKLTRANDFNTTIEVKKFQNCFVTDGSTNGGTIWSLFNRQTSLVLDTTSLYFNRIDGSGYFNEVNIWDSVSNSGFCNAITVPPLVGPHIDFGFGFPYARLIDSSGRSNVTVESAGVGIAADYDIILQANRRVKIDIGRFNLANLTTTERDSLTLNEKGDLIYNTTTNKINLWTGSAWETVQSS